GGIWNAGAVTLDDSVLFANHADGGQGGGIFNASHGTFSMTVATVTLDHSVVFGNHADGGQGGGIFNQGALTLDFSALIGNPAPAGADLGDVGGAVTCDHSSVGERADA